MFDLPPPRHISTLPKMRRTQPEHLSSVFGHTSGPLIANEYTPWLVTPSAEFPKFVIAKGQLYHTQFPFGKSRRAIRAVHGHSLTEPSSIELRVRRAH